MIELYYWPTPNGHKVTMFLEEAGLGYRIHPVDISAGDQFKPEFLAFSPNNRMPAIIDPSPADGGEPIVRIRRHSYLSGSKDRALPAGRRSRPQDGDGMAILANGRARPDGGPEPSLRYLCARKDSLRHQSVCQRDQPPVWRARSKAERARIHYRIGLHDRGYGGLSLG